MRTQALLWITASLAALAAPACGSDDSSAAASGEADPLPPGKEVMGCSECAETDYCIDVARQGDTWFCAPDDCNGACDCLMKDAARRHDECSSSCQDGSGIVYCAL